MIERPAKITLAEMRAASVRGLLIYCSDYRCSHSIAISGDPWEDDVRLSDIEPRFTCRAMRRDDVRTTLRRANQTGIEGCRFDTPEVNL